MKSKKGQRMSPSPPSEHDRCQLCWTHPRTQCRSCRRWRVVLIDRTLRDLARLFLVHRGRAHDVSGELGPRTAGQRGFGLHTQVGKPAPLHAHRGTRVILDDESGAQIILVHSGDTLYGAMKDRVTGRQTLITLERQVSAPSQFAGIKVLNRRDDVVSLCRALPKLRYRAYTPNLASA